MRFLLALLILSSAGCCSTANAPTDPGSKLDAPLRQHLAAIPSDESVDVLLGIGTTTADEAREELETAGLEVRTVTAGVAVARGTRAAIERAATLAWVERIELSQTRPSSSERPGP